MFSKRSGAVVHPRVLETNVSVLLRVVPTRSARVIAVEVVHRSKDVDRK
jgi:hypothetical protein